VIETKLNNTDKFVPLSSLKPGNGFILDNKLYVVLKGKANENSFDCETLEYEGRNSFTLAYLSYGRQVIPVAASVTFVFDLSQAQIEQLKL